MMTRKKLARRTVLRGVGAAVALPFMDAMVPALTSSTVPGGKPLRMAFVYVPNGINQDRTGGPTTRASSATKRCRASWRPWSRSSRT